MLAAATSGTPNSSSGPSPPFHTTFVNRRTRPVRRLRIWRPAGLLVIRSGSKRGSSTGGGPSGGGGVGEGEGWLGSRWDPEEAANLWPALPMAGANASRPIGVSAQLSAMIARRARAARRRCPRTADGRPSTGDGSWTTPWCLFPVPRLRSPVIRDAFGSVPSSGSGRTAARVVPDSTLLCLLGLPFYHETHINRNESLGPRLPGCAQGDAGDRRSIGPSMRRLCA